MKPDQHTDSKADSFHEILSRYFSVFDNSEHGQNGPESGAAPVPQPSSTRLAFLKPIPWILSLVFIFSFYWDFQGIDLSLLSYSLQMEGFLRILSISGLIGFLTNRIAIMMLFRPMRKRPLLGHGLIPAHKERIAKRLARSVSEDLINPELIQKKLEATGAVSRYRDQMAITIKDVLNKPEFRSDLKSWLSSTISDMINDAEFRKRLAADIADEVEQSASESSIDKAALKAYTFLKGRKFREIADHALLQIPQKVQQEIKMIDRYLDHLPELINSSGESIDRFAAALLELLIRQLNVQTIVEENLRSYNEEKLERMIKGATNEQLSTIQYLGAVLGTVGGLVIWQPLISLSAIGILFGLIYLADLILDRGQK